MIDYQFEPHTKIFSHKLNSVRGYLKTLISSTIYKNYVGNSFFFFEVVGNSL